MPDDMKSGAPNPRDRKPPRFFDRWFDAHSDGQFVKTLLIVMLLIATFAQVPSLIYTAYGDDPFSVVSTWWGFVPALAILLFVALDWTILPLGYFFAMTRKPGLKVMLGLLLAAVAFGAFDGYFTATERLIAMRLKEITAYRNDVESTKEHVTELEGEREKMLKQQREDRAHVTTQRADLTEQIAQINKQIADVQRGQAAENEQFPKTLETLRDGCLKVRERCLVPKQEAETSNHNARQAAFNHDLEQLRATKAELNRQLGALDHNDESKVGPANQAVKDAQDELVQKQKTFNVAVLTNQVYRWTGALHGKAPREVTAEEANQVLDIFAATVALAYILAQVFLSISYYGRERPGLVETHKISWKAILIAVRRYWVRKRRGVYRDRTVTKEVFLPAAERTRIVYIPVPPGTPVPETEEFVQKPSPFANGGFNA
jgi:hypothetical protein